MTILISRTYSAVNRQIPTSSRSMSMLQCQLKRIRIKNIKRHNIVFLTQVPALNNSNSNNGNHRYFSTTQYLKAEDPSLWVSSKVTDLKPCVGLTIPELIREHSQKLGCGDATAFECAVTGVKYTHNQVWAQSRGFATSLLSSNLGLKRGDIVAVLLHNIPEYSAVLLGIWDAGLAVTTINPAYTLYEIKHQLQISKAKVVVTMPHYLPAVRTAIREMSASTHLPIIIVGERHKGCHTYFEMVKADPVAEGVQLAKGSEMDTKSELALLPFSSGATGSPKGVMLTHSNVATNILQYNHPSNRSIAMFQSEGKVQARLIGLLPMFHAFGLNVLALATMIQGAHTMTIPRFTPKVYIAVLHKHKPTVLHLPAPIVALTIQHEDIEKSDLKNVKYLVVGAPPVGPSLLEQLQKKAGREITVNEGYGLTEMTLATHTVLLSANNKKLGSAGTPLAMTVTKIVDVETGKTLPKGEKGELCVKGPQMMKGYLNNEEATKNAIDPEGWLHTGDIGYYDKDDYFFIVDRLKELIKVKGFQVAPTELEDLLRSNDAVADVAVIGIPNAETEEAPRAYVVKAPGSNVTEGEIKDFVKGKVASYKELKGGVEFVEEIPRSKTFKILRRVLLDEYKKKKNIK